TYISPVAKPAGAGALDFEVEIEVSLPSGAIPPEVAKPGFAATLEFQLTGDSHVLLPIDAIQYAELQTYVFAAQDGVAVKVPVTVGKDDGERIEVFSGVN